MAIIEIHHKGSFKHTENFFQRVLKHDFMSILSKYGEMGVQALSESTPKRSGKTASSWYYTVERGKSSYTLSWSNSNTNDGVNIAVILQYGHGTGTGGYVKGVDFINPAMRPVFDKIAEEAWRELTK